MAKTNQDRQIKHIKDIFPTDGTATRTESPSAESKATNHDIPKASQASNGDIFYKSSVNGSDGRVPIVGGSVRVRLPSSRKKRPAPKPPDNNNQLVNTSVEKGTEVAGNSREVAHDDTHNSNIGPQSLVSPGNQHLAGTRVEPRGDGTKSQPQSTSSTRRASETSSKQPNHHSTRGDTQEKLTPGSVGNSSEMNGGSPPPPPPVGDPDQTCATSFLSDTGTASSGYQSEDLLDPQKNIRISSTSDPDDGFAEDGFTLDFDEEEEGFIEGRQTILYKEYQGEDFSRYLQEDPEPRSDTSTQPHRGKYRRARDNPAASGQNDATLDSRRRSSGFKDKFGQMFTLSKQHRTKEKRNSQGGNIQSFSFADSKIGVVLDNGANTRTIPKDNNQEQGLKDAGLPKSWWNTDTLSARSLRHNSDVLARQKRSSSVPDLLDAPEYSDPNAHAYGQRDFESYRKSNMYDSKGRNTLNSKKGWWNKFTRTLRKKDAMEYRQEQDNIAVNPLADPGDVNGTARDVPL